MIAATTKEIKKRAEERVEKILKKYNELEVARAIALEIANKDYDIKSSEDYSSQPGGETHNIHSEVENFSIPHLDAENDVEDMAEILDKIDEVIEEELGDRERIVIQNFLIRNLEIEEVKSRLEAYCSKIFSRATIWNYKKSGLKKLVAKGIHQYYKETKEFIDQYNPQNDEKS